jgi:hypothetical protein
VRCEPVRNEPHRTDGRQRQNDALGCAASSTLGTGRPGVRGGYDPVRPALGVPMEHVHARPPVLTYLFADRFMPAVKASKMTVEVPCRGTHVPRGALGNTLMACAFWALREQGAVTLAVVPRQLLGVRRSPRVAVGHSRSGQYPGLEGGIEAVLASGAQRHVHEAVHEYLGRHSDSPWAQVVADVVAEAVRLGVVHRDDRDVHRGRIAGALRGRAIVTHTPHCDRVAMLEPEAQEVHARWVAFQQSEPELHEALLDQCSKGFRSRRNKKSD